MTDAPYAPLIAKLRAAAEDALYASIRAACIEAADALTAQQARERDLDAKLAVHVEALALARTKSAKLSEAALAQARKSAFAEVEAELTAYRDAAEYDATMEGPKFMGWNRSQLDRARKISETARAEEKTG